jgi:hypothetical protein
MKSAGDLAPRLLDVLVWSNPRHNGRDFGRLSRKRFRAGKHCRQALQMFAAGSAMDKLIERRDPVPRPLCAQDRAAAMLTLRLPKNNPQAGAQRLGAYSERAHLGEGTPEISAYNTGVSEGFRQAGINVELSRALLVVGTTRRRALSIRAACDARPKGPR